MTWGMRYKTRFNNWEGELFYDDVIFSLDKFLMNEVHALLKTYKKCVNHKRDYVEK